MPQLNFPNAQLLYRPQSAGIPRAISCYSEVEGIIHYNSATSLRRFVGPPENTYLLEGVDVDANLSPADHTLDPIIEACLLSGAKEKRTLLAADVITRRGVLTECGDPLFFTGARLTR